MTTQNCCPTWKLSVQGWLVGTQVHSMSFMFIYVPSIVSNQVFLYPLPGINEKDAKDKNVQKDASWLWKTSEMAFQSERHPSQEKISQRQIFERQRHQRPLPRDEDAKDNHAVFLMKYRWNWGNFSFSVYFWCVLKMFIGPNDIWQVPNLFSSRPFMTYDWTIGRNSTVFAWHEGRFVRDVHQPPNQTSQKAGNDVDPSSFSALTFFQSYFFSLDSIIIHQTREILVDDIQHFFTRK